MDDETSLVHRFVHEWKVAVPLHAEFGTKPNVFYVPPLSPAPLNADGSINENGDRIPPEYLESLFGKQVHKALSNLKAEIAKKRRGEGSEVMDALILYEWKDALGPFARDPAEIKW
jgi:ethylbenzene hydroxylase subunit beta/complex iron-sulfur molybdoenzyme family reductase subunit beta